MIDLEVFRQTLSCVSGFMAGTGAEQAKERVERRRKEEDGDDKNGHQMQRDEPVQGYACRKQCRCQVRSLLHGFSPRSPFFVSSPQRLAALSQPLDGSPDAKSTHGEDPNAHTTLDDVLRRT